MGFSRHNNKTKSYIVVYLSGQTKNGLYANFKLKGDGSEKLFLVNTQNESIDAVDILSIAKNEVMARDLDGNWFSTTKVTPGYSNTEEGYKKYQKSLIAESNIKINEFLPKNDGNFKNSSDDYVGYIEIINTGEKKVNLKNYCISNTINVPFKYCLSDITLNKNELFVVYMGDYDNTKDETYSNFNLKSKNGVASQFKGNGGYGIAPRTAIGQRKDGIVLMLVIDGRRPGHSLGVDMVELTNIMLKYGAYNASNLDGGGSSTIVVNGETLSVAGGSGYTGDRYLPNAWLVIP